MIKKEEFKKIKFVTDGSTNGTFIYINDEKLDGVIEANLNISCDRGCILTLRLADFVACGRMEKKVLTFVEK